jgi:hypothetical protein
VAEPERSVELESGLEQSRPPAGAALGGGEPGIAAAVTGRLDRGKCAPRQPEVRLHNAQLRCGDTRKRFGKVRFSL